MFFLCLFLFAKRKENKKTTKENKRKENKRKENKKQKNKRTKEQKNKRKQHMSQTQSPNTFIVDNVSVAKAVEQFYLSNSNNSTILVQFNAPINDVVSFQVVRQANFQETLNYVLARVYLYVSTCRRIQYTYNGVSTTTVGVGPFQSNLVMKGINDDRKSAKKLVQLLHGIKSKVNLIYFNPHPGSDFGRPLEKDMVAFQQYLVDHGVLCTIRQSKGLDISAACGQLKDKEEKHDNA